MTPNPNNSILRTRLAQENATLEKLKHSLEIGVFAGSRASVEAKMDFCKKVITELTAQLEIVTKQIHKLYHVELLDWKKKHHYFGSQAAIYETFTPDDLGITLDYLRNTIDLSDGPYENKKCIIRLGEVKRKHTLRGRKL